MASPKKPFFYFEDLKLWEKRVVYFYSFITIGLCVWYSNIDQNGKQAILIGYAVGTQFFLYFGLYTSLRNLKSYLIWCAFGLFQLTLYFLTRRDQSLQMVRGHASADLKNTIVLLFLIQLLRFLSLKLQNREFVAPSHGGGEDLFENKKASGVDYFILFIYMGSFGGLVLLSLDTLT